MAKSTRLDRANWASIQNETGTPSAGTPGNVYINKTNGDLYARDKNDTWYKVTGGGGGGDDTLDTCYNNDSFERTIAVDDGDVRWDVNGNYNFEIDLTGVSEQSGKGFKVFDASDHFYIWKSPPGSLDLLAELNAFAVNCADSFDIAAVTQSTVIVSGATADLTLGARGATIALNESGQTALDGSFSATSIIGAINETKTGLTLDGCYNNDSGERTVTIDAGDLSLDVSGSYWVLVDVAAASTGYGFHLANGTQYIKITKAGTNSTNWLSVLTSAAFSCSSTCSITAGSSSDLTFGARGQTVTLNESGDESLDGTFTATSLVGALNELKTTGFTLDGAYNGESGTHTITVDDGDICWDVRSTYEFLIDLSNSPSQSGAGFKVEDGSDYFWLYKAPPASMDLKASLYSITLVSAGSASFEGSSAIITGTGASGTIRFNARDASVYLNESGATDWDGAFTADSIVGCVNELMTDKVKGPTSAVDNRICRFDSTSGKLIQSSSVEVDDNGKVGAIKLSASHGAGDDVELLILSNYGANGGRVDVFVGNRDPEGNVSANQGLIYLNDSPSDYGAAVYQKAIGTGNTGWRRLAMAPDPNGLSDDTCNGDIITDQVDANSFGQWAALHIDTDGNWIEADADGATTMPCLGLAVESGTGSKKILLRGFVRNDGWSWGTVGGAIYVSTTAGGLTQTAPGSGKQVQIVGWAMSATIIYFCPDNIVEAIP
jgi:hypothetical protein